MPSLFDIQQDFEAMLYWTFFYDDMWRLPGVTCFSSIPALTMQLHMRAHDLQALSQMMKVELKTAMGEAAPDAERLSVGSCCTLFQKSHLQPSLRALSRRSRGLFASA